MLDSLSFKPFDENAEIRIYYHGFLPHWRQAGCTYFVTFRLADSVPKGVVEEWRYERDLWLAARGIDVKLPDWQLGLRRLSSKEREQLERQFTGRLFQYLDRGCGDCQLRDVRASETVATALKHFHGQRVQTGDFVVMPNHVHALLTPFQGFELEEILHSIKSYTANEINRLYARKGTFWMDESHDHIVRDAEELLRIQEYIRRNPLKAKLKTEAFRYQSAKYELK